MGLLNALNTAVSGLNVSQQHLNTLSQNISNANTPNYSNEVVNQQANFIAGTGQGASIASITRNVSDYLNSQVNSQTSVNSAASSITNYYTQIQNLLGQPGGTNSIDQGISAFFTAVQNLANSPSASAQTNVVNSASSVAGQIANLASSLQNLRLQSDSDINGAVNNVNADLQSLIKTNSALQHSSAIGQNTNGLLDNRDATIKDLAQYMDIKPIFNSDGTVSINTSNGVTLLTNTTSAKLSYSPITSVNTLINNSNISPINVITTDANGTTLGQVTTLATGGSSSAVTNSLTSGKLQSLLSMRDGIIPNILSQLDVLASNLRDKVNAINNSGTGFPPPNSYTGTTLLSGNSTSVYSGSVRIAALGSNGTPVSSPYSDETNGLQPLTLNLATLNTGKGAGTVSVDGLINSINQYYGPPQNKVEIGNINNAQLALTSNNIPDSGNTISFAFNLNNISKSAAAFYVGGFTVSDSLGNPIASSTANPSPTVNSTQPSIAVASIDTTTTSNNSTSPNYNVVKIVTSGTNNLVNGDVIYLNPPAGAVTGIPASQLGGYFTVSGVSGNSFNITVAGSGAAVGGAGSNVAVTGVSALAKYSTVNSGDTTNTAGNGVITAQIPAGSINSPYYTVQANIATLDSSGKLVNSVVSYRVGNNQANVNNELIGASNASAGATIVSPSTTQPTLTATLVDGNGNALPKTNGLYGNQQGYLKITSNSSSGAVAIDQMDSKQLGALTGTLLTGGTNQGFSQYFGLNNFFNIPAAANGDTVTNSALNLSVASRIASNPALISTGKLAVGHQPSNSALAPNFTYNITSGDNTVSQQVAALATNLTAFNAVGGLPASTTTFSQYAGQIIAATSTNSTNATNAQNNSQALLDGFTKSAQAVSGVNLDQELANTVIYQNAYSASARIITIVGTMFDALINSIH